MRKTLLFAVLLFASPVVSPDIIAAVSHGSKYSVEDADQRRRRVQYTKHKVKEGESVSSILKLYKISLPIVLEDNPLLNEPTYVLSPGDKVLIRKDRIGEMSDREIDLQIKEFYVLHKMEGVETGQPSDVTVKENVNVSPAPYTKTDMENVEFVEYTVQPKETIYSISKRHNVSVDDIYISNPSLKKDGLKAFTVLRIPIMKKDTLQPTVKGIIDYDFSDVPRFQKNNDTDKSISVAFMLPLSNVSEAEKNGFISMYKGALIALDSLKRDGLNVHVDVFDTGRNVETVHNLIRGGYLFYADIIIGPIYNEQFGVVASYAQNAGIPIISPLVSVTSNESVVAEVPPLKSNHYDKLRGVVRNKKVVIFSSANDDYEFVNNIRQAMQKNGAYEEPSILVYNKHLKPEHMQSYLDPKEETVFVIASGQKVDAEMLYSKVASLANAYPHRKISVLGSPVFGKFDDAKKSELFKIDTKYITSYHFDRLNPKVLDFDGKYIRYFNEKPTMMSYRGYDVMMIFLSSLREYGGTALEDMEEEVFTPLQVSYSFFRDDTGGKLMNDEWPMVNYKTDKTIEVK